MRLSEQIAAAGIVGCGGAGFPTDLKYSGEIEHLVINAAECEPLLQTDKFLMRHFADGIVRGICAVAQEYHIPRCTIALKSSYEAEIASLTEAISARGADISLHTMDSFYPAGDEQVMVYEVTGRIIPPGRIPMSVGVVVDNVGTMLAIGNTIDGTPLCEKYLTVAGLVGSPIIVKAPVGTSVADCLEAAGGVTVDDYRLVMGGPMMGKYLTKQQAEEAVITKTTSALLVVEARQRPADADLTRMLSRARSCCIQCSTCTQLCPRHALGHPLEVHKIMRQVTHNGDLTELLQSPVIQSARLCCECGVCEEYACPMGLAPRAINAMLKRELGAAGIGFHPDSEELTPDPERDWRKVPTKRLIQRMGLTAYVAGELNEVVAVHPEKVEIPLQMHIGPAAVPAVQVGQYVEAGQVIAHRPAPGKGAEIHTGVSGTVEAIGNRIIIRT